MPDLFIGIDPSYAGCGVVVLKADGAIFSTSLKRYPKTDYTSQIDRLEEIYVDMDRLAKEVIEIGPTPCIAIEGYAMGAKFGREMAGELRASIMLGMLNQLWAMFPIHPSPQSVKKYALGTGRSQAKDQVALAVYKKWDVDLGNNDLTDAYVLARIARDYWLWTQEGVEPEHKYELEVLEKLRKEEK